jgi:GNAT superfamily N-acetyltransferase
VKPVPVFRTATPEDRVLAEAFYQNDGYSPAVAASDLILVALTDGTIAGLLRLCSESGTLVLRGMRVRTDLRRRGIGRNLLEAAAPYLDSHNCYCLPFSHLTALYGSIGFRPLTDSALPMFLRDRAARYRAKGERITPMLRVAG